jgi:hypothetical protein
MRKKIRLHHFSRSFLGAVGYATAALPLTIIFIEPGLAQLQYGTGFSPYAIPPTTALVSPEAGMGCPVPSFNITGFAGDNDHWASVHRIAEGSSGNSNYGITAGVTFPFTGSFDKYCRDFAAERLRRFKQESETNYRSHEAYIIEKCISFKQNGFDLTNKAFEKNFPELKACALAESAFQKVTPPSGKGTSTSQASELSIPITQKVVPTTPALPGTR